jgi:hypothetical protein
MTVNSIWEVNPCQSKSLDNQVFLESSALVAALFNLEFPVNKTGKRIVEINEAYKALVDGKRMTNFRFFLTGIVFTRYVKNAFVD